MLPYLLITFLTTGVAYLARKSASPILEIVGIWIVGLILILFAGLRDYHIGLDTGNYVYHFMQMNTFQDLSTGSMEIGYNVLVFFARKISSNYVVLLTIIACAVVPFYLLTIKKFIKNYEFGVYLFIAIGPYTFFFNGARQAIAGAICFWALRYVLQRRFLPYLGCVIVAMLFHKTAVIALAIYIAATRELSLRRLIGLAAAVIILAVFLRLFVGFATEFLGDKYANYSVQSDRGGIVSTFVYTVEALLLFLFRSRIIDNRDTYTRLLNIYLLRLIPAFLTVILGINPSGIMRLGGYFGYVNIILWPMVFYEISKTRQYLLITFIFALLTVTYFYMTTSAFGNMIPYRINNRLF